MASCSGTPNCTRYEALHPAHSLMSKKGLLGYTTESQLAGVAGGQSWDPFRPVQDPQPSPVSSEVLPALGSNAAYTRRSSSKLVLQSRALPVKASRTEDARKEGVPYHRGQSALLAEDAACPPQASAAQGVHNRGASPGHSTLPSVAERPAHTVSHGLSVAAHPQPRHSGKSIANAAVRHTRRVWQRQSEAGPSPTKQGMPQAPKGLRHPGSSTRCRGSAIQQRANTWQRQPQSPRFARRRGNQLMRLSSASSARYSSILLRSGAH